MNDKRVEPTSPMETAIAESLEGVLREMASGQGAFVRSIRDEAFSLRPLRWERESPREVIRASEQEQDVLRRAEELLQSALNLQERVAVMWIARRRGDTDP